MIGVAIGIIAVFSCTARSARVLSDVGDAPEMAPAMAPMMPAMAPMAEMEFAQQFDQCGGADFTGFRPCATGLSCQLQNDFYSQCLRDDSAPEVAQQYEQCGGQDPFYEGPMMCTDNLECIRFSEYYAQCLMDAPEPGMAPLPVLTSPGTVADALAEAPGVDVVNS